MSKKFPSFFVLLAEFYVIFHCKSTCCSLAVAVKTMERNIYAIVCGYFTIHTFREM